jgi:hypothetical protein
MIDNIFNLVDCQSSRWKATRKALGFRSDGRIPDPADLIRSNRPRDRLRVPRPYLRSMSTINSALLLLCCCEHSVRYDRISNRASDRHDRYSAYLTTNLRIVRSGQAFVHYGYLPNRS